LGLSLFLRYANVIVFAAFALGALVAEVHPRRSLKSLSSLWLVVGFVPGALLFSLYNVAAYGQVSAPGYSASGVQLFSLAFLPRHLVFYGFVLLVVYPLMLLAPLAYKGRLRIEILVMTLAVLLAMSAYYYVDDAHGLAENVLVGFRLLLPVSPAFLVAYAGALQQFRPPRLALPAVTAVLLLVATIVSVVHQAHLRNAAAARDLISAKTCQTALINDEATKFFSPAWGSRQFAVYDPNSSPADLPRPPRADVVYADVSDQGLEAASGLASKLGDRAVGELRAGWHVVVWANCS
jgi:hypothetical protein